MTVTEATAPGKVILFGEHAVVYGHPAIAVPVSQVRATARVEDVGETTTIVLQDLSRRHELARLAEDDPFGLAVRLVLRAAGHSESPPLRITVVSSIPIASGLGSGAATATAVIRALARHLGRADLATDQQVADLAFQVERVHHGTPSGIDNTVVAFERPVFFQRRQPANLIEPFRVASPVRLVIGDTGIASPTGRVVGDVRRQWQAQPSRFEALFAECGQIAVAARKALETGHHRELGELMNHNQALLEAMSVSSPELERLVAAALAGGAHGAKLSGGGRGGNMIALVTLDTEEIVRRALLAAGARAVLGTVVE